MTLNLVPRAGAVRTYGEHVEKAASALTTLLTRQTLPTEPVEVDQLLHCRETVVHALRQRMWELGHGHHMPPSEHVPRRQDQTGLAQLDEGLGTLVNNIAFSLPTLPFNEHANNRLHLTRPSSNPTVEAWRIAALETWAATHALSATGEHPWTREPGAGWWVLGDAATALEAVAILDNQLAEVGLLNDHEKPCGAMGLAQQRMVLSHAARAAGWHATSTLADQASPWRPAEKSSVLNSVTLVPKPSRLAAAQRRLAGYITATSDDEPRPRPMTSTFASTFVAGQIALCDDLALAARQSPATHHYADAFIQRRDTLQALAPEMALLKNATSPTEFMLRMWQQQEITTSVARMHRDGSFILTPLDFAEVAQASHVVHTSFAKGLRRDLLNTDSDLRQGTPDTGTPPVRVIRRSPLDAALTDLANLPAPSFPVAQLGQVSQRTALREAVNRTPSFETRSPFPQRRGW